MVNRCDIGFRFALRSARGLGMNGQQGQQSDRLLTAPEAAAVLRMSRWGIYKRLAEIPHIRLSGGIRGKVLFRERDLNCYIERHFCEPKR